MIYGVHDGKQDAYICKEKHKKNENEKNRNTLSNFSVTLHIYTGHRAQLGTW